MYGSPVETHFSIHIPLTRVPKMSIKYHIAFWNCYIKFCSPRTKNSKKLMSLPQTSVVTMRRLVDITGLFMHY